MGDAELCWEILPKVSRSFALCIRILPKPLNEQMMASYLIFRVIDTIEDSHAPLGTKKALFSEFLSLMSKRKADDAASRRCADGLLSRLDYTYEKELLKNADAVIRLFHLQPAGVRDSIRRYSRVMARGMYEFQERKIETFADQNRYSYYVAGVIGYLFNDLLHLNGIITLRLKKKLRAYARKFGLALQKVNILRDIAEDIGANRRYWPEKMLSRFGLSYESLCLKENREAAMKILRAHINDARDYLYAAMRYVLLLPKKALQVRMFCLIPLFMAIESYVKCMDNQSVFEAGGKVKISREQVQTIVARSGMWGSHNEKLAGWFLKSMVRVCPDDIRREYARALGASA